MANVHWTERPWVDRVVLAAWLGVVLINVVGIFMAVFSLPSKFALTYLAVVAALDTLPLRTSPPRWARRFLYRTMRAFQRNCSAVVKFEDAGAFTPGQAYLVAYEPHSVLPLGMALFSRYARAMPQALQETRIMVSSAAFWAAIARNWWWWLGCRPASRDAIKRLLSQGVSCVLCPGGVHEVLWLEKGEEHIYLSQRRGFIRIALEHGASLVPAFAFGQTASMSFFRPFVDWPKGIVPAKLVARLARTLRFFPMIAWGYKGTPIPKQVPLTLVVGRPIPVPKVPQPPAELVTQYQQRFIEAMQEMFERHKAGAGYPDMQLEVH